MELEERVSRLERIILHEDKFRRIEWFTIKTVALVTFLLVSLSVIAVAVAHVVILIINLVRTH